MKNLLIFGLFFVLFLGCSVSKSNDSSMLEKEVTKNDTIRIANDELEYEIVIIDPGFNSWLQTAKPRNYYSLPFLENRNYLYVTEWNNRNMQPQRYDPNLYEMRIDYLSNINYGLEVNYMLYNYFVYFQSRYKQKL